MSSHLNIVYLRHNEIDITKWDNCIAGADNGLIYSFSWYLDHMAKHWDALVLDDYKAVMPLTWNRKYGIYYLYQPFLTPQLGISGKKITKEIAEAFLQAIPGKFQFVEINLNTGNDFDIKGFQLKKGADYCLDLNRTYKTISSHYNENLKRNIKKAVAAGCEYKNHIPIDPVLKLAKSQLVHYTRLQKDDISRFKKLIEFLSSRNSASASGVYHNNELLSCCIFFYDAERVYYILAGNDPKGKRISTSHYLLDLFIREYSGKDIVLDFVGSDFPSIAQFYKSFGAEPDYYRSLKVNRLPKLVKWLKK
jgi:hypothetical protein